MPTVTALLSQPRRQLVDLYLDGALAFTLGRKLAQESALYVGRELSQEEVRGLAAQEEERVALDAAYRYLTYRPRSESEMRTRLRRKGVRPNTLEKTLERLRQLRLLDDAAFAQQWVEHRAATNPRGRRLVRWELRQKGIGPELAQETVQTLDEEEGAYQAGLRRSARLQVKDYPEFRKRLGDFLVRRGFGYEVVERTVSRLWRERRDQENPEAVAEMRSSSEREH